MSLARLATRLRSGASAAFLSAILAACGGGGGGTADPAPTTPPTNQDPVPTIPGDRTPTTPVPDPTTPPPGTPTVPPIAETPPGPVPVATPQAVPAVTPAPAGLSSYLGDGSTGPAADGTGRNARFETIEGLTLDADGNAYVLDFNLGLVRKITPQGAVTTLPKHNCENRPSDLTVGRDGHLYLLALDGRLCRQTMGGDFSVVTTLRDRTPDIHNSLAQVANLYKTVTRGPGNEFFVASFSAVYRVSPGVAAVRVAGLENTGEPLPVTPRDGTGNNARFGKINGIIADEAGNVYVADTEHGVRKVTPQGVVTTLAFTKEMAQAYTTDRVGIVVEPDGAVVVPRITSLDNNDFYGSALMRVAPDRKVSLVPGSENLFRTAPALARDAAGNITYTGKQGVGRVMADGTAAQLAGRGLAGAGQPTKEKPVGVDAAGNLITYETVPLNSAQSQTLRKRNPAGQLVPYGPGGDGVALPRGAANTPLTTLAAASDGTVYASFVRGNPSSNEYLATEIYKVSPSGEMARIWAPWTGGSNFVAPLSMAVTPDGTLYIADASRAAVVKRTPDGALVAVTPDNELARNRPPSGGLTTTPPKGASHIGVSPAGKVHVFSLIDFRAYTVNSAGRLEQLGNRQFSFASAPVFDAEGNVYVQEPRALYRITPAGVVTLVAGMPDNNTAGQVLGPLPGSFSSASSLARSADGIFYVHDNQSIIRIRPSAP